MGRKTIRGLGNRHWRGLRWGLVYSLLILSLQSVVPMMVRAATSTEPTPAPPIAKPPVGGSASASAGNAATGSRRDDVTLTVTGVSVQSNGARPILTIDSTLINHAPSPLLYKTGCNVAPVAYLYATSSSAIYSIGPDNAGNPGAGNTCVASDRTVAPNASVTLHVQYAIGSIPKGIYLLQESIVYTLQTSDLSMRYRRLSDGSLFDSFPTAHVDASPTRVEVTTGTVAAQGAKAVPEPNNSVTGPFTPNVLFIDYDTHPDGTDDGSAAIASQLINGIKVGSKYHNESISSANFQIQQRYVEHNGEPLISDGSGADYYKIFNKYNICTLVDSGAIDFVWIGAPGTESDPVYGNKFYEWVTTGPVYTQTYGASVPSCDRTVTVLFINYDRAIGEATHSFSHYLENIAQLGFGPACYGGPGCHDMYDQFDGQIYRYNGVNAPLNTTTASCGDVHYPPNTVMAYNYDNPTTVQSDCSTFDPGNPGAERYVPVNANTWLSIPCDPAVQGNLGECPQQSYLMWWMQNMPGYNNHVTDLDHNPMPNWWQYFCALDTVVLSGRPIIVTDIAPKTGPMAGGTVVTITGIFFPVGVTVGFGLDADDHLIEATDVVRVSSTAITVRAPAHAPGMVTLYVCDGDQAHCSTYENGFAFITALPSSHSAGVPLGTSVPVLPGRRAVSTQTPNATPQAQPVRH